MNLEADKGLGQSSTPRAAGNCGKSSIISRSQWCWLLSFGILLTACGAAAVIPALTVLTTVTATLVLGIVLMVAGIATVITAFWAGKWSGMLVQLLVGILYVVVGFMITEKPLASAAVLTLFVATFCIVAGLVSRGRRAFDSLSLLGLVAVERHGYLPAGSDHIPAVSRRCNVGHRFDRGPGTAIPRLDVDHAGNGNQTLAERSGLTKGAEMVMM